LLDIKQADFEKLVEFVSQNYGIDLSKKKHLIVGRLSNFITGLGYKDFTEYVSYIIKAKDKEALDLMMNKLTTNYTYFMREEAHFDFLSKVALPELIKIKGSKVINIWSAGCATGEEPYTISMVVKEYLAAHARDWDVKILATDISQNARGKAMKGIYEEESITKLPKAWQAKYFKKLPDGKVEVSNELKNSVTFKEFNLMHPITFPQKFDVIFCRNVMIYFDRPTKDALVNRFYDATAAEGYLFIGHSEMLNSDRTKYKYVKPATYKRVDNK